MPREDYLIKPKTKKIRPKDIASELLSTAKPSTMPIKIIPKAPSDRGALITAVITLIASVGGFMLAMSKLDAFIKVIIPSLILLDSALANVGWTHLVQPVHALLIFALAYQWIGFVISASEGKMGGLVSGLRAFLFWLLINAACLGVFVGINIWNALVWFSRVITELSKSPTIPTNVSQALSLVLMLLTH